MFSYDYNPSARDAEVDQYDFKASLDRKADPVQNQIKTENLAFISVFPVDGIFQFM